MGLFNKKQEVSLETVCRIYYENIILNCEANGQDINALIYETLKKALAIKDSKFANVDLQKLKDEFIIIEFELFSLAWLYQFGYKSAVAQSIFTKNYLYEKGRDGIWNSMEQYNSAITRSTKAEFGNDNLAVLMKKMADAADNCIKDATENGIGIDESLGRPINRLFSEKAWKKGITAGFLLLVLCDRLGFDSDFQPSKELHNQWRIEISDFFDKARESLNKVQIK